MQRETISSVRQSKVKILAVKKSFTPQRPRRAQRRKEGSILCTLCKSHSRLPVCGEKIASYAVCRRVRKRVFERVVKLLSAGRSGQEERLVQIRLPRLPC